MKMNEDLNMKGELTIVVTGSDGQIKDTRVAKNMVVTAGRAYIASRMASSSTPIMSHMAIGSGTTAVGLGNTVMETSVFRNPATFSAATNVVTAVASFAGGQGGGAITEAGIFNDSVAGTMLCHTVFPVVTKEAGDSIAITWAITVAAQ